MCNLLKYFNITSTFSARSIMNFFLRHSKTGIVVLVLMLLCSYSNSSAQKRACPGDDYMDWFPSLVCDNAYFGDVYIGETVTKSITIRAGNSNTLTVSSLSDDLSGVFTFEKPALPLVINGHSSVDIKITFQPQEAKDYKVVIKIVSNGYASDGEIILYGRGLMPLKPNLIISGNVDFGRHRLGTQSSPGNIILENTGNAAATILHATSAGAKDIFSLQTDAFKNLVIEPQQRIELPVVFTPTAKGNANAEFTIVTQDKSSHTVTLQGAGTSGEIFTDISEISFAATELNKAASAKEVIIQCAEGEFSDAVVLTDLHLGNQAYCDDIDKNSFTLPEISLPLTLYPGQSVRIPVNFIPFSAGEKIAQLDVTSDANFVSLKLTGRGKMNENKILSVENNSATEESVIKYSIAETTDVKISVYNITGELVQSVVNPGSMPGIYESAMNNKSLPSGVYFLNIRSSVFNETRSFIITR